MSLKAPVLTENFQRVKLKCPCYTRDLICGEIKEMLLEWEIKGKIYCSIRDGGSYMVQAMQLANFTAVYINYSFIVGTALGGN